MGGGRMIKNGRNIVMGGRRLRELTDRFKDIRIAVAGDFFLDRIFMIDRELDEDSVETGLTAYQVTSRKLLPGSAGTVTNNLNALGVGELYSVAILGDDGEAYDLVKGLQATGVDTQYTVRSPEMFTPTYTKTFFDYPQGIEETHRIDIQNRNPTPESTQEQLIAGFNALADKVDAIICLEQLRHNECGVFTSSVHASLKDIAKRDSGLVMLADSRFNMFDFRYMSRKCNDVEAVRAVFPEKVITAENMISDDLLHSCMDRLSAQSDGLLFVSCGSKGIKVLENGVVQSVDACRVDGPIDICGAGDAATSAITLALCASASPTEAALLGNLVASITIEQIGVTGTATIEQVHARFDIVFNMYI